MERKELLAEIRKHYKPEKLKRVDEDFLSYEEDYAQLSDLEKIIEYIKDKKQIENPNNSILIYLTISDQFDFKMRRSLMVGGSPPDKQLSL